MKVLVDTSVWSLALRRNEPDEIVKKLTACESRQHKQNMG
jgi:predicted nucleic acid-binding protein